MARNSGRENLSGRLSTPWVVGLALLVVIIAFAVIVVIQRSRFNSLEEDFSELEDKLSQLQDEVGTNQQDMDGFVTENELGDYVSQEDLDDYVTKDDLGSYVVEADLDGYLTKEDAASFVTEEQVSELFDEDGQLNVVTREEFNDFRGDVNSAQELAEKVDAVERLANRIRENVNALIERVLILFVGEGDLEDLQDLQIEEGDEMATPQSSSDEDEESASDGGDDSSGPDDLVIVVTDNSTGNREALIGDFVSTYGSEGITFVPFNSLQTFLLGENRCDLAILDNVDDGGMRGSDHASKVNCSVIGNDQSANLNRASWISNSNVVDVCSKNDWEGCIRDAAERALPALKQLRQ